MPTAGVHVYRPSPEAAGIPAALDFLNTGRQGGDRPRTKEKAAHTYTGALTLRAHIGYWAEAGVATGAELVGGTEDPRSN